MGGGGELLGNSCKIFLYSNGHFYGLPSFVHIRELSLMNVEGVDVFNFSRECRYSNFYEFGLIVLIC